MLSALLQFYIKGQLLFKLNYIEHIIIPKYIWCTNRKVSITNHKVNISCEISTMRQVNFQNIIKSILEYQKPER